MSENAKTPHRVRTFLARVFILVLLIMAGLELFYIKQLTETSRLQGQLLDQQATEIKQLKNKLRIIGAIEEHQRGLTAVEVNQLADVMYQESQKYVFDPLLIMALIITESSFQKNQVSSFGAQGLMQLLPATAQGVARRQGISWLNEFDLYNPALNVKLGVAYLFELIFKFKSLKQGVMAYNMGESTIEEYNRYNAEPPAGFYNKVVSNYKMLKSKYGEPAQ
jgi:soluble lytic murein transglycosylase-like protein